MSTIAEVAKEAGVSVATVSRVINKNGTVSAETQQKVYAAIAKFDYHPNVWGRSLRRRESRMLLILVPNISNPYYSNIVRGIEDTVRRNRYNSMLCITDMDKRRAGEYFDLLSSGRADGAILMDTTKDDKEIPQLAKNFPIVQCCEYCGDESVGHVSIDNFKAAYEVVRFLCSIGHRRIGFVGSTNQFISTWQRCLGYEKALTENGMPVDGRYIAHADDDYNFPSGMRAARQLLSQPDRPTAIFCISDVIALAAIRAAGELNLRVPEDLTVVGFDDVEYATMFKPMLTTVSQPCYMLGKNSCEMLLEQINGAPARSVFLEHKIILRDSSVSYTGE
ncbi:LacI family DNA-binding transcriptional regulator [Caproiciproducens sp.]|uniref:LacI family DNA-binding transcriptional regulator n=1 Tax=Caproiciproducens sp. TaxID=1954376 RepID=UPI0028988A0E|nr:LacI family DNA-binding transcriptional regulator [Caproiciproducens sp.]